MTQDRDRTTVRRALRAGLVVAGVIFAVGLVFTGAGGMSLPPVIMTALSAATFVIAAWLLLSYLLDVLAGHLPDRRRTIVTVASVLVAMFAPFLLLGAVVGGGGVAQ